MMHDENVSRQVNLPFSWQRNHFWLLLVLTLAVIASVFGLVLALPLAAASAPSAYAQTPVNAPLSTQLFEANLSGDEQVPEVDTTAAGRAVLALSDDMSTLNYRLWVSDIITITAAHIHEGAPGEDGPIVFTLYDGTGVFDPDNPISGSLTLTPTQVVTLTAGNYYINVHTPPYPGGEIRGQIQSFSPPAHYMATLAGEEEVPEVETEASGVATFGVVATDTLHYYIAVTDIVSITQAHIHRGARGENGPVVHWLYDPSGVNAPGGDFDPDNPISGTVTFDAQDWVDLLSGYFYVNVHTETYLAGEIRGQIEQPFVLYLPVIVNE